MCLVYLRYAKCHHWYIFSPSATLIVESKSLLSSCGFKFSVVFSPEKLTTLPKCDSYLKKKKDGLDKHQLSICQNLPVYPQAAQAPAVRWSSCVIKIMGKIWEFLWEYLQPLFGIKLKRLKMANAVHCLFSDRLLSGNEAILASYTFLGLLFLREREIRRNNGGILVLHQYNRWFLSKSM